MFLLVVTILACLKVCFKNMGMVIKMSIGILQNISGYLLFTFSLFFVCQNSSSCLKLNRPRLVIVYFYNPYPPNISDHRLFVFETISLFILFARCSIQATILNLELFPIPVLKVFFKNSPDESFRRMYYFMLKYNVRGGQEGIEHVKNG